MSREVDYEDMLEYCDVDKPCVVITETEYKELKKVKKYFSKMLKTMNKIYEDGVNENSDINEYKKYISRVKDNASSALKYNKEK